MYHVHVQMVIFIFKEMDLDGFRGSPLFSHRPILVVLDDFTRKIPGNQEPATPVLGDYGTMGPLGQATQRGSTWDQMDMSKK